MVTIQMGQNFAATYVTMTTSKKCEIVGILYVLLFSVLNVFQAFSSRDETSFQINYLLVINISFCLHSSDFMHLYDATHNVFLILNVV